MKRSLWMAGAVLGIFAPALPAGASGDYGCEPSWTLASQALGTCADRGMLAPGNDTRTNLFFLLRGQQAATSAGLSYPSSEYDDRTLGHNFFTWALLRKAFDPAYAEAEEQGAFHGSRCISLASGAQDFAAAMAASRKLPASERTALAEARGLLVQQCNGTAVDAAAWPATIESKPGREFLAYLKAARAFYGEVWEDARQGFAGLRKARDPWVAEAAAYMLPRVELNAAQADSFDEWGSFAGPEKSDLAALARARAGFEAYLKRFAGGRYAASARGLLRRVQWLSGDVAGLARAYERLLAAAPAGGPAAPAMIEEIDNKLLMAQAGREKVDAPLLLATIDLLLMRDAEETGVPVLTAEALAAQQPHFAGHSDLYGFVAASHAYYVGGDMRRVLELIPDDARQPAYTPLAFSRQMLRGMALAALKDRNEAGFWRELLGGAQGLYQRPLVELALALNYEHSGRLEDVFAAGSPIGETAIREILLQYVAGPEILRAQAGNAARPQHERALALFTLLHKQLLHGNYAGFLADSALVGSAADAGQGLWDLRTQEEIPVGLFRAGRWSDGYACPALATTVATLARSPRDARARLCLGEFYRLNGFDDLHTFAATPESDELGGSASRFPGRPVERDGLYAAVIADPGAAPAEKAYALYRAVQCYAPSGNNSCGGAEVDQSQRKSWFQRLKKDYPDSQWARALRYYW